MYDSYTSTVGQYRTYPLGFTHNGSSGSRSPPYQPHGGRIRAPRHNVSRSLARGGAAETVMALFADALEDTLSSIHDAGRRHALRVVRDEGAGGEAAGVVRAVEATVVYAPID